MGSSRATGLSISDPQRVKRLHRHSQEPRLFYGMARLGTARWRSSAPGRVTSRGRSQNKQGARPRSWAEGHPSRYRVFETRR